MSLHRILAAGLAFAATAAAAASITLKPYASGFESPVEITHAGDGSGRVFVVEQAGRIQIVKDGARNLLPFLDIHTLVQTGGEQGLLGLAFHPQYATNGFFFVFHTAAPAVPNGGSDLVVARYRAVSTSEFANPDSRVELLRIPHPTYTNHNGGKLAFGGDGYLYIGTGDGGGGGDPFDAAQNLGDLRGKLLRIDVDSSPTYAIPASNPFVNQPGARGEIFAYGLRNPWRFSFDRDTGSLFIGDVGQAAREEVDLIAAGAAGGQNFGWPVFEGNQCYRPPSGCALAGHVAPILDYGHDATGGFSITGGYVSRGRTFRELRDRYVFGDYVSGRIWIITSFDAGGTASFSEVGSLPNLSTFGEDENGDLYAADHVAGTVFRILPLDADNDGMSDGFETLFFADVTAGDPKADGDGDGVPNLQEYREGLNPTVKDNDIFGVPRLFAMQQYRDFLAREGDESGIKFWTGQLSGAAQTRSQMALTFLTSPEFEGAVAPVVRLYFAYFNRIPDFAGLTHWLGIARAGAGLGAISDQFATSPEFVATYGSLTNGEFVDRVYRNVLGRAPDGPGLAYWTSRLDLGTLTRGQLMVNFSESLEYRGAIGAEVLVTMAYVGMLLRAPDSTGFAFWVGHIEAGNSALSLIDGFIAAAEYRARFLP